MPLFTLPSPTINRILADASALQYGEFALYAVVQLIWRCCIRPEETVELSWSGIQQEDGDSEWTIAPAAFQGDGRNVVLPAWMRDELTKGLLLSSSGRVVPLESDSERAAVLHRCNAWLRDRGADCSTLWQSAVSRELAKLSLGTVASSTDIAVSWLAVCGKPTVVPPPLQHQHRFLPETAARWAVRLHWAAEDLRLSDPDAYQAYLLMSRAGLREREVLGATWHQILLPRSWRHAHDEGEYSIHFSYPATNRFSPIAPAALAAVANHSGVPRQRALV